MPLIEASFVDSSGKSDNQKLLNFGPTVQTIVSPFELPEKPEDLQFRSVFSLLDTGASHSMIDFALAKELNLIPVDKVKIAGVAGAQDHLVFLARILVNQLDIEQYGQFVGANLRDGGQEHDVLLGRDFLKNTIMIYDGIRAQVTIAAPKKA